MSTENGRGELLRIEYINRVSVQNDGCFLLLLGAGLTIAPSICGGIVLGQFFLGELELCILCPSSFLIILGLLQIKHHVRESQKLERLMRHARDLAVPDLPKIGSIGLSSSVWESFGTELEKGETPEQIMQKESDKFLYEDS